MPVRLLPRDGYSWTGYIWLIYLATPIWYAASGRAARPHGALITAIAIVIFLPLYFRGFWLEGRSSLAQIALIATLGILCAPINAGAAVFYVYAASFAGRVGRPVAGVSVLTGLLAVVGLETWLRGLGADVWAPTLPLVVLIGGLNVTFLEIERRQVTQRRAAKDDAQRLAVLGERERIGRDLHDLLGHTLSVITLKAELASKLSALDPARAVIEMRDVERISRDALAEVRRAVQGYSRATLADELRHARTALESAGASLDCDVEPLVVRAATEQALALSIREAITNVIRHARARRCTIRLGADGSTIRLEIQDDGCGGAAADGSGLIGMRARVAEVGGRVERDGRQGTRLTITVPAADPVAPTVLEEAV